MAVSALVVAFDVFMADGEPWQSVKNISGVGALEMAHLSWKQPGGLKRERGIPVPWGVRGG